jgi:RNA polymerase sigma factor (sigma-70 family)
MFDRFAHSPNQGIVKCLVVEDCQTTSEKRLVVAAQRGSREAFAELCQPWAKVILPKVQRITRNREDAEDALQDSFLMAFVHIKDFDGRSKFSTWLTRIAINSALMILRKRHHPAEFSLSDEESKGVWEVSDQLPNPEILYAQRERESILLAAIGNLRPRYRQVLERRLEDESLTETAQILDITAAAAKARLFHARAALRNSAGLRAMAPAIAESAA